MTNVTAVLSMLHEPAERTSATRLFRTQPVLRWTLDRLSRARHVGTTAIICWEDQLPAVLPIAEEERAYILAKGPRMHLPEVASVAAARRWSDGWRGGLLSTCDFDLGFHGPYVAEVVEQLGSDAALLIDPASGLIDAELIEGMIAHGASHPDVEIVFSPAASGLAGVLLRPALIERLATGKTHPGRLLHYFPDQLSREPLAGDGCAPTPRPVARTLHRFKLDSDRQIARVGAAMATLNGHLMTSGAEDLVARSHAHDPIDALPREVVLELNTRRASRPTFWPGSFHEISRADLDVDRARSLLTELAELDDTRIALAGVGDPLLSPNFFAVLDAAAEAGLQAIHVETDLIDVSPECIARLARSRFDVLSVHLPAITMEVYADVMRVEAGVYRSVLENLSLFVAERQAAGGGVPLVAPVFTKCRRNLVEMEAWYDQWLRAVGSAVIRGPSDCAGQIADEAVADMAPPQRKPCARLASRMTVLSDGRVVSCEQDVLGRQVMGNLADESIKQIWSKRFGAMRADHRKTEWSKHALCGSCREWHRP